MKWDVVDARYDRKIDVYSFGIILWEVMETRTPWSELHMPSDVFEAVAQAKRPRITPTKASGAPKGYLDLMRVCWAQDAHERPDFDDVLTVLESMRNEERNSGSNRRNATVTMVTKNPCEIELTSLVASHEAGTDTKPRLSL